MFSQIINWNTLDRGPTWSYSKQPLIFLSYLPSLWCLDSSTNVMYHFLPSSMWAPSPKWTPNFTSIHIFYGVNFSSSLYDQTTLLYLFLPIQSLYTTSISMLNNSYTLSLLSVHLIILSILRSLTHYHYQYHHHYPLWVHCRTKACLNHLHSTLSDACLLIMLWDRPVPRHTGLGHFDMGTHLFVAW